MTEPELVYPKAERAAIASPIGWSSIFAAAAVAAGVWLVLHLFGVGVGLVALDPDDPGTLRSAGIGTGVWSLIAPILALFVGGLVAGRVAPTINTLNAVIHGAVVWAVTALISTILLVMLLGAVTRGAASAASGLGGLAQPMATQLGEIAPEALEAAGIAPRDMVAPINRKLEAQGMPPVEPRQLEAILEESLRTAVRQGGIDRQALVQITAKHTDLSQAQASRVAGMIQAQLRDALQRGQELAAQAGRTTLEVAEASGRVVLVLSLTMILALGAAIVGSIVSVRRERREHVVLPRATTMRRSEPV